MGMTNIFFLALLPIFVWLSIASYREGAKELGNEKWIDVVGRIGWLLAVTFGTVTCFTIAFFDSVYVLRLEQY